MTKAVCLYLATLSAAFAQPVAPLTFELASVKRSGKDVGGPPLEVTQGGGLTAHITLDLLLQIAYRIKPFQLVNAPNWLHSEEYTISAKSPAGYLPKHPGQLDDEMAQRIQSLLVDRFQLVVRREHRDTPSYVLTVAKNGPKLVAPDEAEPFKLRLARGKIANDGGGTISLLVSLLENNLDRRVFDETGLTGRYKFNLLFAPDTPAGQPPNPVMEGRPTLFTALQEQLGLKLESMRRPVEVIVINRIARPTEN